MHHHHTLTEAHWRGFVRGTRIIAAASIVLPCVMMVGTQTVRFDQAPTMCASAWLLGRRWHYRDADGARREIERTLFLMVAMFLTIVATMGGLQASVLGGVSLAPVLSSWYLGGYRATRIAVLVIVGLALIFVAQATGWHTAEPLSGVPGLLDALLVNAVTVVCIVAASRATQRELNAAVVERDEANARLRRLMSIVSHDLRDPIGAITSMSALLREAPLSVEQRNELMTSIERTSRRSTQLISDLLDLSVHDEGRVQLRCEAVPLASLLRSVATTHEPTAVAKSVRLIVDQSDGPSVHADPNRLHQLLSNLVANAIKYTPTGGQVKVTATSGPASVRVAVADTGIGIPAAYIPKLFDETATAVRRLGTDGERSSGFGLPLCQRIAIAHGTQIEVESIPDQGSTFAFDLAIASADPPHAKAVLSAC